MVDRYPPIEPYEHGLLDVGDGNLVYWETCGNPDGKPAVVLHGGPGMGCGPGLRRYFDPARYRIVLFDQRGCGRSTPHAGDPRTDMAVNTTDHLLGDLERLRTHLGIERWLVFGGSWGAVLALAYALRHPDRVSELLLTALAAGRYAETEMLTRGLGRLFPLAWARFRDAVPESARDGNLAAAYNDLLEDPDPAVRAKAARDWCDWEDAMLPTSPPSMGVEATEFQLAFVRIVTHYWRHECWLPDGQVLREGARLAHIPTVLVQGTLDLGNLLGTPWLLANALPGSELHVVDDAGHDLSDGITAALITATDRFATDRFATELPVGQVNL